MVSGLLSSASELRYRKGFEAVKRRRDRRAKTGAAKSGNQSVNSKLSVNREALT